MELIKAGLAKIVVFESNSDKDLMYKLNNFLISKSGVVIVEIKYSITYDRTSGTPVHGALVMYTTAL